MGEVRAVNSAAQSHLVRTITILPVRRIHESISWYEKALGFRTEYINGAGEPGEREEYANYAVLSRDGVPIHLIMDEGDLSQQWTRAGTGRLYLKVNEVQAFYEEVVARGIQPSCKPMSRPWGVLGFDLIDPSGNAVGVEET